MQQQEPEHDNMGFNTLVSEGTISHYKIVSGSYLSDSKAQPKDVEFPLNHDEMQDLELAVEQSLAKLGPQREIKGSAPIGYLRPNISGINPTEYLDRIYEGIGHR